jgi:RND family efflux transporter MFP subunit
VIAQVQGTVQSLPVAEGARIRKGDVLVRLYAPELEASAQRLQADRNYWKQRYDSDQRLLEQKAIPSDQAEASKRASISAQAAYDEVNSRLQKTIEKAVFDGIVLKWYVEPGQHVMPGQPLMLVGNTFNEIRVNVIEEDVRYGLQPGTPAIIKTVNGKTLPARIAEVAPMADAFTRTMTVKIHWVEDEPFYLPNGASIPIDFILQENKNALAVPGSSIGAAESEPYLYLIRDERAYKQRVRTGIEENGWVAVEFAWNGSDLVAITNLNSLSDSAAVFAVALREVR